MKLAIFVDQIYWRDGEVYSNDESFTLFLVSFREHFDVVLIGRVAPEVGRKPYLIPQEGVMVCPLPYYSSVFDLWRKGTRIYREVRKIVRQHAGEWDAVLSCGPNPIANTIAKTCIGLNVPTALVVRQNLIPQIRFANKGLRGVIAVNAARYLEWEFRRLARNRLVFVMGQEMARAYGRVAARVYDFHTSLVDDQRMAQLAGLELTPDPHQLLFVGRLSSEKGLNYLFTALVELKQKGHEYRLDIVGAGPIEQELQAVVASLGLQEQVRFHGYVAFGDELLAFYKRASILMVPSLSGEGLPGVINEALAVGVPVIATTVGGIPDFVTDGETAILLSPTDVEGLKEAMLKLTNDAAFRKTLISNGRALMRRNTLEANRQLIVDALHSDLLTKPSPSDEPTLTIPRAADE